MVKIPMIESLSQQKRLFTLQDHRKQTNVMWPVKINPSDPSASNRQAYDLWQPCVTSCCPSGQCIAFGSTGWPAWNMVRSTKRMCTFFKSMTILRAGWEALVGHRFTISDESLKVQFVSKLIKSHSQLKYQGFGLVAWPANPRPQYLTSLERD